MWGTMRTSWTLVAAGLIGCSGNIGEPIAASGDGGLPDAGDEPVADAAPADAAIALARCDGGDAFHLDTTTGHCYIWFDQPVSKMEAAAACLAEEAYLATITSADENAAVALAAPDVLPDPEVSSSIDSWLGGNDIAVENTFVWETGEPFAFDGFREGEPNNNNPNDPDGEDCMVFEGDSNEWDDRSCNLGVFRFICEREPE